MTRFQFRWHVVTTLVVATTLFGQLASSISGGMSPVDFFSYFTIQSNSLVLAAELSIVLGLGVGATWFRLLRLAALTGITVTFCVYAVLIGPKVSLTGIDWWLDQGLHVVTPLLAVFAQVIVGPRTRFDWRDLLFVGWPVAWLAWTFSRVAWGNPRFPMPDESFATVPYDFLDTELNGTGAVMVTVVLITAFLLAIAAGFIAVSRRSSASPVAAPVVK